MGSMQRSLVPAVAGTGILASAIIYSSRSSSSGSSHPRSKRDEGLSGAGIGGNAATGGHELGSVNNSANPDRKAYTTASSRDELPSGGVGGGVGRGSNNARFLEFSESAQVPGRPSSPQSGSGPSSTLGSLFGTGGSKTRSVTYPDPKNTRVASNYDGTPTKHDATKHDQHQPVAPRTSGGNDGNTTSTPSASRGTENGQTWSQSLNNTFSRGGDSGLAQPGEQSQGFRNPKIASNHAEPPTKKA